MVQRYVAKNVRLKPEEDIEEDNGKEKKEKVLRSTDGQKEKKNT